MRARTDSEASREALSSRIGPVTTTADDSPPPLRAILLDGSVVSFLSGKLISSVSFWAQSVAAAALMFELTGSALMVGLVGALQTAPTAVLALAAGMWSDRFSRRKLLVLGRITAGTAMLALGATAGLGPRASEVNPWVLAALVGVSGLGWAIGSPSMSALLPTLVSSRNLEAALSLNATIPGVARTVGPLVGGFLLAAGGPAVAFVTAASGHLIFALALLFIREPGRDRTGVKPGMLGGVEYLRGDRRTLALIVGIGLLNFGAEPAFTLAPSISAHRDLDLPSMSVIVASFGAGALIGAAAFRLIRFRLSLPQVSVLGCAICSGGLVIAAVLPAPALILGGFLLNGFGFILASVAINTRVQQRVPDTHRGRIMAIWSLAFFGLRPVSALVNGGVADSSNWQIAMCVSAFVTAAAVTLVHDGRQ